MTGFHTFGNYRKASLGGSPTMVHCPEQGREISLLECFQCDKFGPWGEADGSEIDWCIHEYKDKKSRGFFDETWNEHPENFDPEMWQEMMETKANNERVRNEFTKEQQEIETARQSIKKEMEEHILKEKRERERFLKKYGSEIDDDKCEADEEDDEEDSDSEEENI